VLKDIFQHNRIIRTRDADLIKEAYVAFDVGGIYDNTQMRYDHHFKPVPARPDGRPYSSFGLIWKHHGMTYLRRLFREAELPLLEKVHQVVDDQFVSQIDRSDNGMGPEPRATDASRFLEAFNPSITVDQATEDKLFKKAVCIASKIFKEFVKAAAREQLAHRLFRTSAQPISQEILVFEADSRADSWLSLVQHDPDYARTKFVVHPDGNGGWRCRAVPIPADSFKPECLSPITGQDCATPNSKPSLVSRPPFSAIPQPSSPEPRRKKTQFSWLKKP
jgi:uncharacterized UPF0160 family protein